MKGLIVDRTHLVLASGKQVLQKTIIKKVVEGLLHKKLLLGSFFFITKTLNGAWEFLRDISDRMNGAREKKHFKRDFLLFFEKNLKKIFFFWVKNGSWDETTKWGGKFCPKGDSYN